MPLLYSIFFGTATRALFSALGIGTASYVAGVKTSNILGLAAAAGTLWYLSRKG